MKGRTPKPPSQRQNRNRASTRAKLPSEAESLGQEVPDLPQRDGWGLKVSPDQYLSRWPDGPHADEAREALEEWHSLVVKWWEDVWTSPMAGEFLEADKHGLYLLAELHQQFYEADSVNKKVKIASEIRLQAVRFGLSPIDRRRLQWEVKRTEEAEARAEERRKAREARRRSSKDPREMLKVEK